MKSGAARWLQASTVIIIALAIIYAERFVTMGGQHAVALRALMDVAAFAIVFLGLRFWLARRALSNAHAIGSLVLVLLGFLSAALLLPRFQHTGIADTFIRFASSHVAESIPALVALAAITYAIVWSLRRGNR